MYKWKSVSLPLTKINAMENKPPLVIVTAPAHPWLMETLQQKGFLVDYAPQLDHDGLLARIALAEGLVVTTRIKIDRRMLEQAGRLKWIGRLGSGMEMIDMEFARSKGIRCVSSPEGNCTAVAEHVLGLILNLNHRIGISHAQVKQGQWLRDENRGVEISGKTVGIIGYGNTGSSLARLLKGFGVTVLAYDKYKYGFSDDYVKEASFEQVCAYAQIISFHVPLTEETTYLAGTSFFNALKQQPLFVNASRGGVTDTDALIRALSSQTISGAALDVLENEQISRLSDKETMQLEFLLNRADVIITPHIAGYSHEAFFKMSETIIRKLGI